MLPTATHRTQVWPIVTQTTCGKTADIMAVTLLPSTDYIKAEWHTSDHTDIFQPYLHVHYGHCHVSQWHLYFCMCKEQLDIPLLLLMKNCNISQVG